MAASSRPAGPTNEQTTPVTLPPGTSVFARAAHTIGSNPTLLPPQGSAYDNHVLKSVMFDKLVSLINEERFIEAKSILKQRPDWLELEVETLTSDAQIQIHSFKKFMLQKLCEYIDDANEEKAAALLRFNPSLLLSKAAQVVHRVKVDHENMIEQVYVNITPFQLAYAEDDPEMCEMMKKYFVIVLGSEEAANEEIHKQIEEKHSRAPVVGSSTDTVVSANDAHNQVAYLKAILVPILQAITNEQFGNEQRDQNGKYTLSEATLAAIEAFRKAFVESQPKEIEHGKRFHLEVLQGVYEAYAEAASQWRYDYKKCALFEDSALSIVLNYVAKNDAQRFSQGLYYLQDKGEGFTRARVLRHGGEFYSVLHRVSPDFSLSSSCVDIEFAGVAGVRARSGASWRRRGASKLISNKNAELCNLTPRVSLPAHPVNEPVTSSRCVIL